MALVNGSGAATDSPAGTPLIGYDNQVTVTTITSSTEDSDALHPITNVANPATHTSWRGGVNTGNEVIDITGNGSGIIDYVAIAGHNLGSQQIPVTIQNVGVSPAVTLVTSTLLTDDEPTIFRFAPSAYTTIRVTLDLSNVDGGDAPEIAVLYCGKLLILERGIKVDVAHVPITYGRKTSIVNGMSESGNFLGRIVLSESRQSKAEFFGFTPTFFRTYVDPFLDVAQEVPFFWAWAPSAYPLETGFAWLTSNPQPEVSPDTLRVALTLEMNGIA